MSVRLYVGNLPKEEVNRDELHAVFAEVGDTVTTKVIKDRKTGKCRGFAFVTVPTDELADQIIEKFNGQAFQETTLKIEKALPRTKGNGEEEEGNGEEREVSTVEKPTIASERNIPAPSKNNRRNTSSGSGSSGGSSGGKKTKRAATVTSSSGDSDTIQPDPRWADQLAILKQRLEAQTTNP